MKLRTLAFVQMPACYRNIIVGFVLALVPVLAHAVYDPILRSGFESTPTFYVAGNGNNANPGTLAQPWKTINRAVRDGNGAPAGSIVYVKAGTYNEQVIIERDDIQLIGYTSVPGDQPPILANAPINPDNGNPVFPAFNPNEMPLLDGGNRASGIGINLRNRRGISVRNFNVRNYAYGLIAGSEDPAFIESHLLDNVNVSTIGDITAEYSGIGIGLGSMSTQFSNGSRVQNALIINAAAEGLKTHSSSMPPRRASSSMATATRPATSASTAPRVIPRNPPPTTTCWSPAVTTGWVTPISGASPNPRIPGTATRSRTMRTNWQAAP